MGTIFQDTTPYGNCQFYPFVGYFAVVANGNGDNTWFGGLELGINCEQNEKFVGNFAIGQEGWPTGFPFTIQYSGINLTSATLPYNFDNGDEIGTPEFVDNQFETAVGFSGFIRIQIDATVSFNGNYPGFFKNITLEPGNFVVVDPGTPGVPCDCCCCA